MGVIIVTGTPGIGSIKKSRLEIKTKKYYLDGITKHEIQKIEDKLLWPEQTTIREAYFGKYQFENKIGLNLLIDYKDNFVDGTSFATLSVVFTKKKDIEGLIKDLNVKKVEDLAYKQILAYRIKSEDFGRRLVAISACP